MKLAVGQTWRVIGEDNQAYFLITRFSEENRGWMALTVALGDGWLPYSDGDEILVSVNDEVTAPYLELFCDAPELV